MGTNPSNKAISTTLSRGDRQDDPLAIVRVGVQLRSVQNKEYLHGRMSDPFIAINERMILNQGEGERGGFFFKGRIKILSAKGCPRLRGGRFQSA
jgi:hypothetical protein